LACTNSDFLRDLRDDFLHDKLAGASAGAGLGGRDTGGGTGLGDQMDGLEQGNKFYFVARDRPKLPQTTDSSGRHTTL
jgi:hypothetical protein